MSIEQKIAEMLAESKAAAQFDQEELVEEELSDEVEDVELDEEQLDELSKTTLGSYARKATSDTMDHSDHIGDSEGRARAKLGHEDVTGNKAKLAKRQAGLNLAAKKLGDKSISKDVEIGSKELIKRHKAQYHPALRSDHSDSDRYWNAYDKMQGHEDKANDHYDSAYSKIKKASGVKEDVAALVNGEDLSEEFKQKAATIFEAAIVTRVKQEVARLEEEFEQRVEEGVEQRYEGLIEKVDGYLNYIVESWIEQNEIALERGMKSEILENFVHGLKNLFEENYIDVPEEKYDLLGEMEETIVDLKAKLNEQLEANVELNSLIAEAQRGEIIAEACSGLTDTEVEKFVALAEELSYEDSDTFANKVHTIRENYFNIKPMTKVVDSVVTDEPVVLTEETAIDPTMKRYVSALNILK